MENHEITRDYIATEHDKFSGWLQDAINEHGTEGVDVRKVDPTVPENSAQAGKDGTNVDSWVSIKVLPESRQSHLQVNVDPKDQSQRHQEIVFRKTGGVTYDDVTMAVKMVDRLAGLPNSSKVKETVDIIKSEHKPG